MFVMVKQLKNKIKSIQTTIQTEETQFNSDIINSKKQISNLKEQIRSLKNQIDVDQKLKKLELTAQLNTSQRQYTIYEQQLTNSLNDIKKELNREITTFKATQMFLKNKL
eukprot:414517_1